MSQIPSNTEQFLGGLAASQGFLQQAGANQRAKMDYALAQQQMGLEQQKMQQQGQQFERGLQAEAENYRKLNESRERLQSQELAQGGLQFGQRMQFDKEQANLERLVGLKMKQLDMDMMRNEQEIAAMADDDPRLQEARAKRRRLRSDLRNLEQLMGSSQLSMQLAQGVKTDRIDEVDARLDAFKQGLATKRTSADQAFKNGLDYAVLRDSQQGGFVKEVARLEAAMQAGEIPGMQRASGTLLAVQQIIADNLMQWGVGTGQGDIAEAKATEFMKNGGAMATQVVKNALELNGDAFGLKGTAAQQAGTVIADMVAKASILANVDPRVRAGGGAAQEDFKRKIAAGFGELRKLGMGDEQIASLLDGLESMSQNRAELLRTYVEKDPNSNQANILANSLQGVGKIQDVLESVAINEDMLKPYGGKLVDHSKYDWVSVSRKARMAYGMGQNPKLEQLMGELRGMGMGAKELEQVAQLLIESDPNLQFLRPEEFAQALRGMGMAQQETAAGLDDLGEDIGRIQGQVMARGRLRGLSEADRRLADIESLLGG